MIFPETVTPTDHQGNKKVASARIVNGSGGWSVWPPDAASREVIAEFVMIVVGGLKFGAIYSLAALGIVVIYKATRIVNFAHGAFVLAGAYATYGIVEGLDLGYWPAYLLVPIATGLLAAAVELRHPAADTPGGHVRSDHLHHLHRHRAFGGLQARPEHRDAGRSQPGPRPTDLHR